MILIGAGTKHKTGLAVASMTLINVCAFLMGYGLFESAKYERLARGNINDYSAHTSNRGAQNCVGKFSRDRHECLERLMDDLREYEHNQYDLLAQRQSALWAYVMAATAILGIILSAVGVWLVKTTFDETRAANDIARDTAKRQLRAYITTENHQVVNFGAGLKYSHICQLHNRGQTPAYDVRIWSRPVCIVAAEAFPQWAKIRKCGEIDQSKAVLGPGQWVTHHNASTAPLTQDSYIGLCSGDLVIIWGGLVTYRDAFGKRHATTFKYAFTGDGTYISGNCDMTACSRGNMAT